MNQLVQTPVFFNMWQSNVYNLIVYVNMWKRSDAGKLIFQHILLLNRVKETLALLFSCEFCEISNNTFFITQHLRTTASVQFGIILQKKACRQYEGCNWYSVIWLYQKVNLLQKINLFIKKYFLEIIKDKSTFKAYKILRSYDRFLAIFSGQIPA